VSLLALASAVSVPCYLLIRVSLSTMSGRAGCRCDRRGAEADEGYLSATSSNESFYLYQRAPNARRVALRTCRRLLRELAHERGSAPADATNRPALRVQSPIHPCFGIDPARGISTARLRAPRSSALARWNELPT